MFFRHEVSERFLIVMRMIRIRKNIFSGVNLYVQEGAIFLLSIRLPLRQLFAAKFSDLLWAGGRVRRQGRCSPATAILGL